MMQTVLNRPVLPFYPAHFFCRQFHVRDHSRFLDIFSGFSVPDRFWPPPGTLFQKSLYIRRDVIPLRIPFYRYPYLSGQSYCFYKGPFFLCLCQKTTFRAYTVPPVFLPVTVPFFLDDLFIFFLHLGVSWPVAFVLRHFLWSSDSSPKYFRISS